MSALPAITKHLPFSDELVSNEAEPFITSQNDTRVVNIMQSVISAKESHVEKVLANKWRRYDPILIGGDAFSMAYLGFQGLTAGWSSLQSIAAVTMASSVCGMIGGVINIGVAFSCLREAIPALRAGDKLSGIRLLCDAIFCFAIGVVMFLASLAQIVAIAGIGAFFTANPWVLPVLFFIITIPILYEIFIRNRDIWTGKDLGSKINLKEIQDKLSKNNWDDISKLCSNQHPFALNPDQQDQTDANTVQELSDKMEKFQMDIGVKAALSAHKLMMHLKGKHKKEASEQLADLQKEIDAWNYAQKVRLAQQVLFVLSFVVSMVALPVKAIASLLNSIDDWFMSAANAIPLYMDIFWPFKRNTLMVVPPVKMEDLPLLGIKA